MSKNDVKQFDWFKHLTSFSAMKDENHTDFFGKSSIALQFLSPHFLEMNFVRPDCGYVDLFFSTGSTIYDRGKKIEINEFIFEDLNQFK